MPDIRPGGGKIVWILALLAILNVGLLTAHDDLTFDDEDLWESRAKRDAKPRHSSNKKKGSGRGRLSRRQTQLDASGSGEGSDDEQIPTKGRPTYFRVTFTLNEGYESHYADSKSEEFTELAKSLDDIVANLYYPLPGRQTFTVVSVGKVGSDPYQILVTGDIGTVDFYDRNAIRDVLQSELEEGKLGRYTAFADRFSFKLFQAGDNQGCMDVDQIKCRTGAKQCISFDLRCDGKNDCDGGEDEENCTSLVPEVVTPDNRSDDQTKSELAPDSTNIDGDDGSDSTSEVDSGAVVTPESRGQEEERVTSEAADPPMPAPPPATENSGEDEAEEVEGDSEEDILEPTPQLEDSEEDPDYVAGIEVDPSKTSEPMVPSTVTPVVPTPETSPPSSSEDPTAVPKPTPGPDKCRGDNKFTCRDGTVICDVQKCDGSEDCPEGDDEENCPGTPTATVSTTTTTTLQPVIPCQDDEWECTVSECLPVSVRCNGVRDCDSGSDEVDCPTEPPACTDNQFRCNDGSCIDLSLKCDSYTNCPSREDEENCRCEPSDHRCGDGKCVSENKICDRMPDCDDGSDEVRCGNVPEVCQPGEFRCGDGTCIDIKNRCNRRSDCPNDDEDEKNCPCGANEWQCDYGQCIDLSLQCDGKFDCPTDGSDEINCPDNCQAGEFRCGSGECIASKKQCDGVRDCGDGADEDNCPSTGGDVVCSYSQWRCLDRRTCVSNSSRCDGRKDCPDNSDEVVGCSTEVTCNPYYEWRCWSRVQCIDKRRRCDGVNDCRDRSDEHQPECQAFVATTSLPPSTTTPKCRTDQFLCESGECIDIDMYCDSIPDCSDGSDEVENCDDAETPAPVPVTTQGPLPPIECPSDSVRCGDGKCVGSDRICDGIYDCVDGKDERDCSQCRRGEFRCESGLCIPESRKCDRQRDCPDGSDELDCGCPNDHFECDGGRTCISTAKVCDQRSDCRDGFDERNCRPTCRRNEFQCGDGSCVDETRKCDGSRDCTDGSDELGCVQYRTECRKDQFRCGTGTCLDPQLRCDGFFDCIDFSDEDSCEACRSDQFRCGTGQCIDIRRRCDRNVDCPDRSDEDEGVCGVICQPSEFRCQNNVQCVSETARCNGRFECNDQSDETNCPWTSCEAGEFRCENGPCISESQRCDGKSDCPESSDELDCPAPSDGLNLKTYPSDQTIKEGREVVFQCRDEGPVRAPVRWLRGSGLPLPLGSRDSNGRLEIPNVQLESSGTYICEAVGYPASVPGSRVSVYLRVEPSAGNPLFPPNPHHFGTSYVLLDPESYQFSSDDHNGVLDTPFPMYIPELPKDNDIYQLELEETAEEPTVRPPTACALNEATCMNGQCVDKSLVCDGNLDCADGSDEMRCPSSGFGCEPNEFQCSNKRCVLKTWRCDGDDDCGDNSDEGSCTQLPSGSNCKYDEFQCSDGSQCIPKSFHCDMEIDCQDRSDEIGCAAPTIAIPPSPIHTVEVYDTFVLNCTAVGKPVPEIVWRLNWGHVPPKCSMTSENGFGVLTCPDAVETDQGAYSCEAINSKGSTFAVPDCIVVVKPRDGVCRNGVFNAAASSTADCVSCFCFGVTSECSSSSQVVSQLPQPSGQFQIVGVSRESRGYYAVKSPLSPSYLRTLRSGQGVQIFASDRRQLGDSSNNLVFFNLPPSHRGNQLRSYGSHLKYRIEAKGQGQAVVGPDVVLAGNGYTLTHFSKTQIQPNRPSDVLVRFWPGQWYKRRSGRPAGDIPSEDEELATREEIMMALQNLDYLLIRAGYVDSNSIDTTLSNVQMDTSIGGRGDQAVYVEECRCPPGYAGMSCETCAPGFRRVKSGPWLGRCVEDTPTICQDGSYGDPGRGVPCQPCPCPSTTGITNEVRTCYLDTDGQVTCNCPAGYDGRRCESCAAGYNRDARTGEICRPGEIVECNVAGSASLSPVNSQCPCKEIATFASDEQDFALVDTSQSRPPVTSIRLSLDTKEIFFRDFKRIPSDIYYWRLPLRFLGNKITSYGGSLNYTVRYVPQPGGQTSKNTAPDVEMLGNNMRLIHFNQEGIMQSRPNHISVLIQEKFWQREDGSPVTRENLLVALADVDSLIIKATYTTNTLEVALADVSLDVVSDRNTGKSRAMFVEVCKCPKGYKGTSCEDCAPGFSRTSHGVFLGTCEPCSCNGHSRSCHPETGICEDCRNSTTGDSCEKCLPGFVGDPSYGGSCLALSSVECDCDSRGSLTASCYGKRSCRCKTNVEGQRCDQCRQGTYGLSADNAQGCLSCYCSGLTSDCSSASNLYRSKILMSVSGPQHGFTLSDSNRFGVISEGIDFDPSSNSVSYAFTGGRTQRLYWSLPPVFTGNKLNSYGSQLTITQYYEERSGYPALADGDIFLIGNGISIFWIRPQPLRPGSSSTFSVPLRETGWIRMDGRSSSGSPASREDFLMALSNVEALLVRATFSLGTTRTRLTRVAMGSAVENDNGDELAVEVEECRCPPGSQGHSCEACSPGYYRDSSDRSYSRIGTCKPCQCSGNEESCLLGEDNQLICNCKQGYSGRYCEQEGKLSLEITPEYVRRKPGSLVRFKCSYRASETLFMKVRVHYDDNVEVVDDMLEVVRNANGHGVISWNIRIQKLHRRVSCSVKNSAGIVMGEVSAQINPEAATSAPTFTPTISISVGDSKIQIINVGNTAYFRCSASSSDRLGARITLKWTKQGDRLPAGRSTDDGRGQLTISRVQSDDAGTYVCSASDGVSTVAENLVLDVAEVIPIPPPTPQITVSVSEPRIQIVQSGQTARFTCSARSLKGGRISLRWSKQDGALPTGRSYDDRRGILTITGTRPDDAGNYVCTATDGLESAYETVVLEIGSASDLSMDVGIPGRAVDPPRRPVVSVEPKVVDVVEGRQVEVRCLADGYPKPTITWTSRTGDLPRGATQDEGVLKIASVRREEEGEYTCTARNPSGQSTGRLTIYVRQRVAPVGPPIALRVEPQDSIIKRGDSIKLVCSVDGGSQVESFIPTWTKSSGPISSRGVQSAGTLIFSAVTPADSGIYICTVTGRGGQVQQAQARITVLAHRGPPTVRVEPERQTISQGTLGELRCLASGDPTPSVRWSKVGEELSSNVQINGPVLRITSALIEDRGMYVCTAENAGGSTQAAAVVEVDRREPPRIEMYPSGRQTITRGASAIFQCRITGGIPTPSIKWSRQDGRSLSNTVEELQGGVIRFNRVTGDETGQYLCEAQNEAGVSTAAAVLEVQKIPTVTITPSGSQRVTRGQRVRLECRADGDPVPSVSWKRVRPGFLSDDTIAAETSYVAIYDIASVTSSDEGAYSCVARNAAGVAEQRLQLVVESSIPTGEAPAPAREDAFTVPVGGNAEMSCLSYDLEAGSSLEWVRSDGSPMPYNHFIREGTLYINDVQPEASGEYTCQGITSTGVVQFSARARLTVIGARCFSTKEAPPKITIQPVRQIVKPGDLANVYCSATGESPITIGWSKVNGQLPPSVVLNGGHLQFRSIEASDTGRYVCVAQNSVGTAEATAEVIVNVAAPVYSQGREQIVQAGNDVTLRCDVPLAASLRTTWRRDRGPMPPTAIPAGNVLNITNVQVTDSGRYYCDVTTQGSRVSEYILLQVENHLCPESNLFRCKNGQCFPMKHRCDFTVSCKDYTDELDCNYQYRHRPRRDMECSMNYTHLCSRDRECLEKKKDVRCDGKFDCQDKSDEDTRCCPETKSLPIKISSNVESVQLGDNLEIRCEVTGEPSALVSWSKMGGEIPRNVQPLGSLLRVYGVSAEDGGVYRCSAVTPDGRQEEDYVLAIQANSGNMDDSPTVETKSAPIGSTVVMDCRSNLQPPLTFSWSRQGGALPKDANPKGATVTLPNVRAEDAGTYICTVTSTVDSQSLEIPTILSVTGVVPYFPQAPLSFLSLPTLPDAYLQFDIEISFKPEVADGLILYNGQQSGPSGDFISFGLSLGYPEFRFDMGSGPAIIRADTPIEVRKWHTVRLSRNKKDGIMIVNDRPPYVGSASGRFQGLDLLQPLYIGGVPDFRGIHKQAGFNRGFVGCISRLVLGGRSLEIVQESQLSKGVTSCETCAVNACLNKGVCQEAYAEQGYSCLCTPGFSGYHCEKIGETCYPGGCGEGRCVNEGSSFQCYCPLGKAGPRCEQNVTVTEPFFRGGAYASYITPKALRRFRTSIRFKPGDTEDSVLLYCGQNEDGQGDFISLGIRDQHVEFRFDTGSGPAILRSDRPVKLGEWTTVTADRNLRDGTLVVNDMPEVKGKSPGTMGGLNLKTDLYLGGWDKQKIKISPGVGVNQPFNGCVSQMSVSGLDIDLINGVVDSANVEDCKGPDGSCTRAPCQNGGDCVETGPELNEYRCTCIDGFSGTNCEREPDVCSLKQPCRNGGTCVTVDRNDYRCLCPKGWGGKNCAEVTSFGTEGHFAGDSYVELDRLLLPHTSQTAAEVITVEFSTTEPNGILFWHGQKPEVNGKAQDYISLAIVDGFVEFSYELGSGPAKIITQVRVDDGKRHKVVARRTARDGSLEVDNVFLENGQSGGTLQMLNSRGSIYIGGVPNIPLMTAERHKVGLKGCIHKLSIQTEGPIDLFKRCLSSVNVTPCSSPTEGRGDISFSEADSDERDYRTLRRRRRKLRISS